MENKLLPIGSVVLLKGAESRIMIAGYCAVGEDESHVWDYSGVIFPRGYTIPDQILQFDHEQIAVVFAMGYQDIEQFGFMGQLEEAYMELKGALPGNADDKTDADEPDEEDN